MAALTEQQQAENAQVDKECLKQLKALCEREGVTFTGDKRLAMYLGQYEEVMQHFGVSKFATYVSTQHMIDWLRDNATGKRFWKKYCAACGLPVEPYDTQKYEIEHILNVAWGGVYHPLNYMVLWKALNRAPEFVFGPGHLKMSMVGRTTFEHVQCFARWWADPLNKRRGKMYNFLLSIEAMKNPLIHLFNDQRLLPFKTVISGAGPSDAVDHTTSLSVPSRKRALSPALAASVEK